MYQSDYILRMIEDMAQFLRKAIEHTQTAEIEEIVTEDGIIDETAFFEYRLNKSFYAGRYCEAEDLLLHRLQQVDGVSYINTALQFYQRLGTVEPQKLAADGYSEERITEGLKQLRNLYPVSDAVHEENRK